MLMAQPFGRFPILATLLALTLSAGIASAAANELLPRTASVAEAIDHYIDQQNRDHGRPVAPLADDDTILRRSMLDVAGRIPTVAERDWFYTQPVAERRMRLVEYLLQLPDSPQHLRDCFDELLLANKPYNNEFREYLLWAIEEKQSWDRIFTDIMLPHTDEEPQSGAAEFIRSRVRALDDLTNDSSVLFFGVNVSCAKCHDHPLVDDWKQDHYFGMQAFFNRTFETRNRDLLEKPFGGVTFTTTEGTELSAPPMFLDGTRILDSSRDYTDQERNDLEDRIRKLERDADAEPIPDLEQFFSPRSQLVKAALADSENHFFAKNITNRIWQRLLGIGIVDPPDQMHSGNPPSHPALLDWLTRDLVEHDYDLWRLVSGIVSSKTYARSSAQPSGDEVPGPQTFAVARPRALTPRQLALSLLVAARNPDDWNALPLDSASLQRLADLRRRSDGWSREFQQPRESFQVAVDEALFFSNGERVQKDLLRDAGDSLIGCVRKLDDVEAIDHIWTTILSRPPTPAERDVALTWLSRNVDSRIESIRDLVWATLAGAEMRFNH